MLVNKLCSGLDKVLSATALLTAHQAGPDINAKADDRGTPIGAGQQMETEPTSLQITSSRLRLAKVVLANRQRLLI